MSAKNLPILFILFLFVSCQPDPAPSVSNGGLASPDLTLDSVPVSDNLSLPPIFEDNESNWISLSYTDAENDQATSCQIFNRSYVNVTSACTCLFGSCFLKVKPFDNYSGVVSFQYSVTANNLTSEAATASFIVVGVADAPSATERTISLYENTTYSSDGTISYPDLSGTDPDGDSLTCIKVTDPSNGAATLNADCSFSYTPVANFEGADSFTFKVNDGVNDSAVATVSINVLRVNETPVANNSTFSTYQNIAGTINFSFTDSDAGDPFSIVIVSGPSNGTLSGTGLTRTYTPDANFLGADSLTFMVNDGTADSNVATVTINVDTAVIYLSATGNDATGTINDPALPFLTAQAAVDAAIAYNASPNTPLIFDVGTGNFGPVNLSINFGTGVTWRGDGAASSIIGDITANAANGAAGTATGDPLAGDWDGGDGATGLSLTFDSDFTVTFGNITVNGGNGGLHAPDNVTFAAKPGNPGNGGFLFLTGIFGNITALGGSGHGGAEGGNVVVRAGSTVSSIDVSGGSDLCTVALDCRTIQSSGQGGDVTVEATAIVNGNITSKGAENNGLVLTGRMIAGSGGDIHISGTVNGSIFANGGDTYDSQVGEGGLVNVLVGGVVTGDVSVLTGIFSNDGALNFCGEVNIHGTAQDIYAHSDPVIGGYGGAVQVTGTANDIYLQSPNSSCTLASAGDADILSTGIVNNIYASGGNATCNTTGAIHIAGTVTGIATVDGGDSSNADVPGNGGLITLTDGANVNILSANGGDAAATTCNDGGSGGAIDVYPTSTYNPANFTVNAGTGDAGCGNVDGVPGTITIH